MFVHLHFHWVPTQVVIGHLPSARYCTDLDVVSVLEIFSQRGNCISMIRLIAEVYTEYPREKIEPYQMGFRESESPLNICFISQVSVIMLMVK